ncbi:MAG TPA: prenyltransferase/squalene oxidase repeat-containing protein [Herpetosiphonaceae bacterium]
MDTPLVRLLSALTQLGQDGAITPSIYDTAQCIRFATWHNVKPAISWLLDQQYADGGWGDPHEPLHRIIPTLSAILALQIINPHTPEIAAALKLLQEIDQLWPRELPPDLSVAAEIIIPNLVAEARVAHLDVPPFADQALMEFSRRRMERLKQQAIAAGSPALHSWEIWGADADENLLDGAGSIGHSPSATALWLHRAQHPSFERARTRALRYIHQSAAATGVHIYGVVPTVWPISRFEQTFSLYGLATLGLLQQPEIQLFIAPIVDDLLQRLRTAGGTGMSDAFQTDGDTTAAAVAIVRAAGRQGPQAIEIFQPFMSSGFTAYPGEMHGSISVQGRMLQQLAIDGYNIDVEVGRLCTRQLPDGTWPRDKWNVSWLYSAWHAMLPLSLAPPSEAVEQALDSTMHALRRQQHPDGGWGPTSSQLPDTTFAMLALLVLQPRFDAVIQPMLAPAHHWLDQHIDDPVPDTWIGKQLYSPILVDRILSLTALVASRAVLGAE